eukprot:2631009-Amphidinium_carterae.1
MTSVLGKTISQNGLVGFPCRCGKGCKRDVHGRTLNPGECVEGSNWPSVYADVKCGLLQRLVWPSEDIEVLSTLAPRLPSDLACCEVGRYVAPRDGSGWE